MRGFLYTILSFVKRLILSILAFALRRMDEATKSASCINVCYIGVPTFLPQFSPLRIRRGDFAWFSPR